MRVSVVICTWNRAKLLDTTLTQLGRLTIPSGVEWELLVVNNNCTDATDEVISQHAGRLPLRLLHEPRPGKSNALNMVLDHVRGDLILWTDDDVLIDRDWLAAHVRAAAEHPEMAWFGGPIFPYFEEPPPDWLTQGWRHIGVAYAAIDFGSEPFELNNCQLPFGANYAVRTDVQRRYLFDPKLGRNAGSLMAGEETVMLAAMHADGHRGWWTPQAKVQHFVDKDRMTLDYVCRYFAGLGQTRAVLDLDRLGPRANSTLKRAWRHWRALAWQTKYQVRRRVCQPETWVRDIMKSSYYRGRLTPTLRRAA